MTRKAWEVSTESGQDQYGDTLSQTGSGEILPWAQAWFAQT